MYCVGLASCRSDRMIMIQEAQLPQRKRASNMTLSYGAKGISMNRLGVDHEFNRRTDRRTDRLKPEPIVLISPFRSNQERRLTFTRAKLSTRLLCDSEQIVGY